MNTPSIGTLLKAGLQAGILAGVINVILWYIGVGAGWYPDQVVIDPTKPDQILSVGPMAMFSVVWPILGALGLWLLFKITAKYALIIFNVLVTVLIIAYLYPPFMIKGASAGLISVLEIAHAVVGVAALNRLNRAVKLEQAKAVTY